jgi:hypothetical protein
MEGRLFIYNAERRLPAFLSQTAGSRNDSVRKVVVFIGGLTDGFLATPYLAHLQSRIATAGWSLVQVLLSSSYAGYGHSSLRQDVEELDSLLHHLVLPLPIRLYTSFEIHQSSLHTSWRYQSRGQAR